MFLVNSGHSPRSHVTDFPVTAQSRIIPREAVAIIFVVIATIK